MEMDHYYYMHYYEAFNPNLRHRIGDFFHVLTNPAHLLITQEQVWKKY